MREQKGRKKSKPARKPAARAATSKSVKTAKTAKTISTAADPSNPEPAFGPVICEVCCADVEDVYVLSGCDRCGRLFGPCCNSQDPDLCVECV